MAQITLVIPDAQIGRVVDALCLAGHWSEETGLTRNAFAKAEAARLLRERVLAIERQQDRLAAEAAIAGKSEPDIT